MKQIKQTLRDSRWGRWAALIMVSFTMLCAYYLTDAMAPLQSILQSSPLNWSGSEYGFFTSGYGWFNVFLLMLVIAGMVLDKMGVRFTGILSISIMIIGAFIKYWAISGHVGQELVDLNFIVVKKQVLVAGLGFAFFGVGCEMFGITANKAVIRWFKGKEMALAIGLNTSVGRIGTALAMFTPIPLVAHFSKNIIAKYGEHAYIPILVSLLLLCVGLLTFICFCVFDKKLDKQEAAAEGYEENTEEGFKLSDIAKIAKVRAFWYITILCVLFYSAVFPFIKYATNMMQQQFHIAPQFAGYLPALLPLGALILTPLFGSIYDKKGKGATIMIIGSVILVLVHLLFAFVAGSNIIFAIGLIILLGIGFSLVPAAMWPSVAKIIPEQRLGTAYALTFWIQNWGLMGVPLLIGFVLDKYCKVLDPITQMPMLDSSTNAQLYNYQYPFIIFAGFGVIAIFMAFLLKIEDKKMGYGLEKPNIED